MSPNGRRTYDMIPLRNNRDAFDAAALLVDLLPRLA